MAHCDRLLFCLLCGAYVSCYMAGSRLIRTRNGDFRLSPFKVRFLFKERVEKTCRGGGGVVIIVLRLLFVSRYVQFNPLRAQTALLCSCVPSTRFLQQTAVIFLTALTDCSSYGVGVRFL